MANLKNFPYIFFNNQFVKAEEAKVSVMTNALQYGTAVFGGIRGYFNQKGNFISLFRIDDHLNRLLQALNILGVPFNYTHRQLKEIIIKLVKKNRPKTDIYLRPFAYAANLGLTPTLNSNEPFAFTVYMIPLGDYLPTHKGLSVCVSSWRRIADNAIPSRAKIAGGYINSALAKAEAVNQGFDEAIFLNQEGHVAEGSAENIFLVKNGVLITPAVSEEILEGITRRSLIQIANDLNIPVEERVVDRSELYVCQEAFFAGTGVQIAWIASIDKRQVGNGQRGKITSRLQDLYFQILRGNEPRYEKWCTKICLKLI